MAVLVGLAVSALLVLAGWTGASLRPRLVEQYPWFTLAALGVTASGVVQARWLLAGFLELRRRQREVLLPAMTRSEAGPRGVVAAPPTGFLVVAGGTRYHRPTCAMVAGKQTELHHPSEADSRRPCGICLQQAPA
ncbi:MAG: hypothetical protein ABR549_06375 [Mycobacteriales bacterium]